MRKTSRYSYSDGPKALWWKRLYLRRLKAVARDFYCQQTFENGRSWYFVWLTGHE